MGKAKAKPAKDLEAQQQFDGMEDEKNPKVHAKALRYAKVRDERCALSKDEDAAKTDLIETMKEAGLERYKYRELLVDLTNKTDIKVKIEKVKPKTDADAKE